MDDKLKLQLVDLIEVQVVGMLIEHGICEYIKNPIYHKKQSVKQINSFDNLKVKDNYAEELKLATVSEKVVQEIQDLYPKGSGKKGTKKVIRKKLINFINENPEFSIDDIKYIIQEYVNDRLISGEEQFLFNLDYIFYKQDSLGTTRSPFLGLVDKYYHKKSEDGENSAFEI